MISYRLDKGRGFLLIFSLLLTVLIALISLSLLNIRKASYASSQAALKDVQARALARSGIADVWVKVTKDPLFPSGVGDEQLRFSYRENVERSGRPVGSYTVTIDRSYRISHEILLVEATGSVGTIGNPGAVYTIAVEISTAEGNFGIRNWQDGVSPSF